MNSKRFFKVLNELGHTLSAGIVVDTATRVNNTAINAGVAVAALYGLDPVKYVTAGKTEEATGLKPILKLKVREGESAYKAIAV
jgi:hypothetical protein